MGMIDFFKKYFGGDNSNTKDGDKTFDLGDLKEIESGTFKDCKDRVEEVTAANVTKVNNDAFKGCVNLKRAFLFSAKNIGNNAFQGCESLEEANFGNVETLGNNVFDGCVGLKRVYLPSLKTLGTNIFEDCKELESIVVKEDMCKKVYDSLPNEMKEKVREGIIEIWDTDKKWDYICAYSQDNCQVFYLPDDVDVIGSNMFDEYRDKIVTIKADEVTTIEDGAFKDCEELGSVILPKVSCIGSNAFEGCGKLLTISIAKLDKIGNHVFDGCNMLSTFYIYDKEDAIKIYKILPDDVKKRLNSKTGYREIVNFFIENAGVDERLNFDNILKKNNMNDISVADFE